MRHQRDEIEVTCPVDLEPEIVSWGEGRLDRLLRWPGGSGGHRAVTAAAVIACCLIAVVIAAAVMVSHRDQRIQQLESALRSARQSARATAGFFPAASATAIRTFPDKFGGLFTMVTAEISPRFGTQPLTWLFVFGRGIPGHRYGLLGGSCHNGPISYDWASATAGTNGNLAIVADNLAINPVDPHLWVLIHPLNGTEVLGGTTGPFLRPTAGSVLTARPC